MAFSLTALLMLLSAGLAAAAEKAPAASGYPQVATYEPVFVSSKKPLPLPPAALTKPIVVPTPAPLVLPTPSPVAVPAPVKQVQVVEPPPTIATTPSVTDALKEYQILLEPPTREVLLNHLDSESMLEKRMRQQAMQRSPPDDVKFPPKPIVSKDQYKPRSLPPAGIFAEPNFVCHDRLYCEERNGERYGWNLGFIQTGVSTAYFIRDAALIPFVFASRPFQRMDTSAGKCLPGDPVPYLFYPLELSAPVKGAIFGMFAAFP